MTSSSLSNTEKRFGFVALVGEPNSGKSTLMNQLVGAKVSIVSPKAQTTRTRVLGVVIEGSTQIAFVDTPGIFQASKNNKMEKAIVTSAWEGLMEAETILLMVDVSKKVGKATRYIIDRLKEEKTGSKQFILVLNKIDCIKKEELLDITTALNQEYNFAATFMISALKAKGLKELMSYLARTLPMGEWHYPEDHLTDMPMKLMAAEVTREKLFRLLHQELPYGLTVETEKWEEFKDGSIKIDQVIYINREAHKRIILGKGGSMIKKIGQQAREELEQSFGTSIHLKLFVKVDEDWMDEKDRYALWGLSPDS